jgi:hypothetical protein
MTLKTRFDVDCETLGLYFAHEIEKISPQAKSELPKDVSFKLFRGGGKFNANSTSKLGFLAKLYVLWKALNKKWWIIIEDEDNGMTPGQFMELRKAYKKRDYGIEKAQTLVISGTIVMANKELSECCAYLNRLSTSPSYHYLIKGKNSVPSPSTERSKEMQYICSFLVNYEKNKKTWVAAYGISIPEWLVLIYLYHGKEINGSPIYKEVYRRAYQSSPTKLRSCFSTLQNKRFIQKTGIGKGAMISITPLGKDTVDNILTKYALNC